VNFLGIFSEFLRYSELDLITMEEEENKTLRERVIETEIHPEKTPNSPSHHYSNTAQLAEEGKKQKKKRILTFSRRNTR
jgi:hypothetical protein